MCSLCSPSFGRHVNGIREGDDPEGRKKGLLDKMKDMRDGISDRIPQQHKDKASDHIERGKHFLSEEYFPEGRRDQFIYRGKKVCTRSLVVAYLIGTYANCRSSSSAKSTTITRSLSSGCCRLPKSMQSMANTSPIVAKTVILL